MKFTIFYLILTFFINTVFCLNKCSTNISKACRITSKNCNRICKNGVCEIRAAVILPNDTNTAIMSLPNVMPELELAIEDAYNYGYIPKWLKIKLIEKDDRCEASSAQIATIDSYTGSSCMHAIFGPVCDYCIATVSRIVKFFDTPIITAGGFSNDFDKDKKTCDDEYYMLVRTGKLISKGLSQFFKKIFDGNGWRKIAFLYDNQGQREIAGKNTCSLMMQTLAQELKEIPEFQYKDGDLGLSSFSITQFLETQIGTNFGIIIMCASRETIHNVLLAAADLKNMIHRGEYLFYNIELNSIAPDADHPWIETNVTDENRTKKLKDAYKNVFILTSLKEEVIYDSSNMTRLQEKSNYPSGFYDGMLLYLKTIKRFLRPGGKSANINTTINGYEIVCNMFNQKFTGRNGEVQMNDNGDRFTHYSLLSYNPQYDKFEAVANYTYSTENSSYSMIEGKTIYWPSGRETAPPDTPICGFDDSKCESSNVIIIVSICVISLLFVTIGFIAFAFIRNSRIEEKLKKKRWLIAPHEIQVLEYKILKTPKHVPTVQACTYKNKNARVKEIPYKQNLTKKEQIQIYELVEIQHENLVKFFGIFQKEYKYYAITELCVKGSLNHVLRSEQYNRIDNMLSMSFIKDLISGMHYIHESDIKTHGSLTSKNCLVDSRLVLKIADFGLSFLYNKDDIPQDDKYWKSQIYKAPELLRNKNAPLHGTQKGDVYSFGIILHEIIFRAGPFGLYAKKHEVTDYKNIVELIKDGSSYQPSFPDGSSKDDANSQMMNIMKNCFAENEADRPDFHILKSTIKSLNKDHESGDMMDNLLSRLEQYANNLETLVEERTIDYMKEKEKCETLVYQLMPKTIARQLISGKQVQAELFEEVTIYFSDIVGFTELSARSQPMEIVEFLNDLYTKYDELLPLYDVYKVETIGDAYMVASGLPIRNGTHCRELARFALDVLGVTSNFKIKHRPNEQLQLRVGLHTGPCVAGIVGQKMPRYCLFGDTVNTANRMESTGEAQRIHISRDVYEILKTHKTFQMEKRGMTSVKGKGKMETYWLNGENPRYIPKPTSEDYPLVTEPSTITITTTEAVSYPTSAVNSPNVCNGKNLTHNGQVKTIVQVNNPAYSDTNTDDDNASQMVPLLSHINEKKT